MGAGLVRLVESGARHRVRVTRLIFPEYEAPCSNVARELAKMTRQAGRRAGNRARAARHRLFGRVHRPASSMPRLAGLAVNTTITERNVVLRTSVVCRCCSSRQRPPPLLLTLYCAMQCSVCHAMQCVLCVGECATRCTVRHDGVCATRWSVCRAMYCAQHHAVDMHLPQHARLSHNRASVSTSVSTGHCARCVQ